MQVLWLTGTLCRKKWNSAETSDTPKEEQTVHRNKGSGLGMSRYGQEDLNAIAHNRPVMNQEALHKNVGGKIRELKIVTIRPPSDYPSKNSNGQQQTPQKRCIEENRTTRQLKTTTWGNLDCQWRIIPANKIVRYWKGWHKNVDMFIKNKMVSHRSIRT